MDNLGSVLLQRFAVFADSPALNDRSETSTYHQLSNAATAVERALRSVGLTPDEPVIVPVACLYSGDPAPLGSASCRQRARRKRQTQGTDDAHHRAEFWIAGFSKRLVKAHAVQARILRNFAHAACACDEAECIAHKIRVTGFERRRNIGLGLEPIPAVLERFRVRT